MKPVLAERTRKDACCIHVSDAVEQAQVMEDNMARRPGASQKAVHARYCMIQAAIGRMLSAQYDLKEPLTDHLENLLRRIENADEISSGEIPRSNSLKLS
jgi:hypothetical protein